MLTVSSDVFHVDSRVNTIHPTAYLDHGKISARSPGSGSSTRWIMRSAAAKLKTPSLRSVPQQHAFRMQQEPPHISLCYLKYFVSGCQLYNANSLCSTPSLVQSLRAICCHWGCDWRHAFHRATLLQEHFSSHVYVTFSDRTKTDFLVSAENEYSAQSSKHCKNVNLNEEQKYFLGLQLQVAVNCQDLKNQSVHKILTMSNTCLFFRKKLLGNGKLLNKTFFVSAAPAEYSFRPNIRPKTVSADH
jgi:hypothetical protein